MLKSMLKRTVVPMGAALVMAWGVMHVAVFGQSQKSADPQAAKVRAAIEQYVQQDTKLKGGFLLRDPKEQQVRDLALDFVHSGLESGPGGTQVMCVDFLDRSKNRLDIDFFVKPAPSGELQVTDIKIHKVNGTERK